MNNNSIYFYFLQMCLYVTFLCLLANMLSARDGVENLTKQTEMDLKMVSLKFLYGNNTTFSEFLQMPFFSSPPYLFKLQI